MATDIQILEMRNNIDQIANEEPWTDEYLGGLIDAYGILEASARVWDQKAAAIADMGDISEGGSSRKSVLDQYLKLSARFRSGDVAVDTTQRAPRTREAVRQ